MCSSRACLFRSDSPSNASEVSVNLLDHWALEHRCDACTKNVKIPARIRCCTVAPIVIVDASASMCFQVGGVADLGASEASRAALFGKGSTFTSADSERDLSPVKRSANCKAVRADEPAVLVPSLTRCRVQRAASHSDRRVMSIFRLIMSMNMLRRSVAIPAIRSVFAEPEAYTSSCRSSSAIRRTSTHEVTESPGP